MTLSECIIVIVIDTHLARRTNQHMNTWSAPRSMLYDVLVAVPARNSPKTARSVRLRRRRLLSGPLGVAVTHIWVVWHQLATVVATTVALTSLLEFALAFALDSSWAWRESAHGKQHRAVSNRLDYGNKSESIIRLEHTKIFGMWIDRDVYLCRAVMLWDTLPQPRSDQNKC